MTLLLNVLWFIFGGLVSGVGWLIAGVMLALTIVGLPWAQAAFRIGLFTFFPFGKRVVDRRELTGRPDLGTGDLGLVLNIVWLVLAGWWLALGHVIIGVLQCCTLIGIPFGLQHFKLAWLALAPVGKAVVEV
jgi:uncharacterized membrane protein YccF (DUF307 family)